MVRSCAQSIFVFSIFCTCTLTFPQEKGSFVIDYDHDTFLLNGNPFHYVSGSIHYPRIHPSSWDDRLHKMQAAGLDAISTYVMWNVHEPQRGVYDFSGPNNLTHFLDLSQQHDLYVILRAGPYICAEWEFGGLPAWLMATNASMKVRTMDKDYISAVDTWLGTLLPLVQPYLIQQGGPIIAVQVENEYGSYDACDSAYMQHLAASFRRHLGNEVVLFTTDGNSEGFLKCGATNGVYATVDFGVTKDVKAAFEPLRKFNKQGPLVNSELYAGWLDYWGEGHSKVSTNDVIMTLSQAYAMGASVNLYMFEGGTTFGFMNGVDPVNKVEVTSYDYDAPLSEAGDVTMKFEAVRRFMLQHKPKLPPIPANSTKEAYNAIDMTAIGTITSLLPLISSGKHLDSLLPLNMEQMNHYYGFVLYRHTLRQNYASGLLQIPGLADRAYVLLDERPAGILDSSLSTSIILSAKRGQQLDLIVENLGRINYGSQIRDGKKGIIGNVTWGGSNLTHWSMRALFDEEGIQKWWWKSVDRYYNDGGADDDGVGHGGADDGHGGDDDDGVGYKHGGANGNLKFVSNREYEISNNKNINSNKNNKNNNNNNKNKNNNNNARAPSLYLGYLVLPSLNTTPHDTFLDMCGWSRGVVWVNGFNLGRYRPQIGPQSTLYLPGGVLKGGRNQVLVLEMEGVRKMEEVRGMKKVRGVERLKKVERVKGMERLRIEGDRVKKEGRIFLMEEGGTYYAGGGKRQRFPIVEKGQGLEGRSVFLRFVDTPKLDSTCF